MSHKAERSSNPSTGGRPERGPLKSGLKDLAPRIGTSRKANPHQFFSTPELGTAVFLAREARRIHAISDTVWECACGAGAMVRVLEEFGFRVVATDIRRAGVAGHARIAGEGGVDFLTTRRARAKSIVTNPPYAEVAARFIRHAIALGVEYLALLLPSGFFQANRDNIALFRQAPPTRIWPIGFRLDFTRQNKALPMPHSWFVWDFSPQLGRGHLHSTRDPMVFGEHGAMLMPALTKDGVA